MRMLAVETNQAASDSDRGPFGSAMRLARALSGREWARPWYIHGRARSLEFLGVLVSGACLEVIRSSLGFCGMGLLGGCLILVSLPRSCVRLSSP